MSEHRDGGPPGGRWRWTWLAAGILLIALSRLPLLLEHGKSLQLARFGTADQLIDVMESQRLHLKPDLRTAQRSGRMATPASPLVGMLGNE